MDVEVKTGGAERLHRPLLRLPNKRVDVADPDGVS